MQQAEETSPRKQKSSESLVLYCLLRKRVEKENAVCFLLIRKHGSMTFPPTKFRPGENLYSALIRPMEDDLHLPNGSYYPEEELEMIPNEGDTVRYAGLPKRWYLYPVDISLSSEALNLLETPSDETVWWTLDQIFANAQEPNVIAIAKYIAEKRQDLTDRVRISPSMDAIASYWAGKNQGGIRILRENDIHQILDAGSRAFNLRVADPYLAYQKQGLGFTWSFFTPKDKQDVHVHGLPAVEIYGVIEGRLQIWYKSMNQRGVRAWQYRTLEPGDWAEVEPLYCHFAFWLDAQGLGTVIKAAGSGELAGVGKLGVAGKTVCKDCNVRDQCMQHPRMIELLSEYQKPYEKRDYEKIAAMAGENTGYQIIRSK